MHVRPALALAVAAGVALSACSAPSPGGAASGGQASATADPTAARSSKGPTSSGPQASPNGVADVSANEAMARAAAALAGARSVHVVGDVRSEGTHVVLDLQVAAGRTGRGTVTLDGARIDVVATADAVYLGGNAAFLEQAAGKGAADLFRGKYLRTTRKDPPSGRSPTSWTCAPWRRTCCRRRGSTGRRRRRSAGRRRASSRTARVAATPSRPSARPTRSR